MREIYKNGNAVSIISDECCVTTQKEVDYIVQRFSTIVMESRMKKKEEAVILAGQLSPAAEQESRKGMRR